MTCMVNFVYRIINAVRKHIKSKQICASRNITVRIEESADFGVIVTGVKGIELCLSVVVITAVEDFEAFKEFKSFYGFKETLSWQPNLYIQIY